MLVEINHDKYDVDLNFTSKLIETYFQLSEETSSYKLALIKLIQKQYVCYYGTGFNEEMISDEELYRIINTTTNNCKYARMGYAVNFTEDRFENFFVLLEHEYVFLDVFSKKNIDKYTNENQLLKRYDWWYFPDFPDEIMAEILETNNGYSTQKLNQKICQYYSANDYEKTNKLLEEWIELEYFVSRKIDLEELIAIHKLQFYNTAITISMIIIEGTIRDYVREKSGGYYRFKRVRKDFKNFVDSCNDFFDDELDIISYILQSIDNMYEGNFSPSFPESFSDLLRDKRMHGQAYNKQTETASLKMLLLIDELFYMLSVIEDAG